MDLSCKEAIKGSNAIFLVLTLSGVFCFFGSFINDSIGRKMSFILFTLLSNIGSVLSLLKQDYTTIVFGLVLQTLGKVHWL